MTTRITAVRSAFPAHCYPQDELAREYLAIADTTGALRPSQRGLIGRLFANSGIATRHTVLPADEYAAFASPNAGPALANDRYIEEATALGEQALRLALASAGVAASELDFLIVTSVTGVTVPSLDARLIPLLGLRPDITRLPVFGLGCLAGAAGLARLHDHLRAWPKHVGAHLAVELCTLTLPRREVTTADLVSTALFGDGAAAVVAVGEAAVGEAAGAEAGAARLPQVIATRSEVYPDSSHMLGWRLGDDGFRMVLRPELGEVVECRLHDSVTAFLSEHGLTIGDIESWICHPGGPKVLDAAQRALKLPDSALETSRRSLSRIGNVSSVSVLHILELTANEDRPARGSYGMMIGLGPGISVELLLLKW